MLRGKYPDYFLICLHIRIYHAFIEKAPPFNLLNVNKTFQLHALQTFQSQIIDSKVLIRISWLESRQRRNCLHWRTMRERSGMRAREGFTFSKCQPQKRHTYAEIIHPPARFLENEEVRSVARRKSRFPSAAVLLLLSR